MLITVNNKGIPNAICATCVSKFDDETIVIANNYFEKTMENVLEGSEESILFITKNGKSYQLKGELQYYTEGMIFDDMKTWNPKKHPGHGALALKIKEIYSGSEKLI